MEINKGSSDGVEVNQPVINGKGLVGKVKAVSDGNAVVMLLSDSEFGVSARAPRPGQPGSILPVAGSPGDLLFDLVPAAKKVRTGDTIVTAGTISDSAAVPVPAGLLIGAVKRIDGEGELDRTIHVDAVRRPARARLRAGADQADRRPARRRRHAVTWNAASVWRLVAIGLVGGILQLTTVSQIAIFGVPADLSPLLVATVGLLCGSIAGASFGFGLGLFMDTLLAQTLGLTSLVLLVVGYAAGRLRELRDPAHGLVPVAVGAAATAVAAIGFAVLQFLLGVDAPVSLLLDAPDPDDDRAQHAAGAARLPRLPPRAGAVPARRPAPPPAPRLHHRRPEPAQPRLAPMPSPIEERRPPITPQLAVRVAVLGGFAFVLFAVLFFRLWFLQVLTGDDYVVQARENRVRKVKIEAPRGNIVDRDGEHARQDARRAGRADPAQLGARRPSSRPPRPTARRSRRSRAAGSRPAQDLRELERRLRADGRRLDEGASARGRSACAPRRARAEQGARRRRSRPSRSCGRSTGGSARCSGSRRRRSTGAWSRASPTSRRRT